MIFKNDLVLLTAILALTMALLQTPTEARGFISQPQLKRFLASKLGHELLKPGHLGLERVDDIEYDDFGDMPPFLKRSSLTLRDPKSKRYLGIDIPDYISGSGGKSEALKSMSDKMKAMGRK